LTLTAADAGSGVAMLGYRYYPHGSAAPAFTKVAGGGQVSFKLSGADGSYQVDWQATDYVGNTEALHSLLTYLDNTAPVITIIQPTITTYLHSATLSLGYAVSDGQGSGLFTVKPTLDNQTSLAGHGLGQMQPIVLLVELALGSHVFAITAQDNVGNSRSASVTFTIIATPDSIKQDVSYFQGTGDITSPSLASQLLSYLNSAEVSRNNGFISNANLEYQAFITLIAKSGTSVSARAVAAMTADAQYLINNPPTGPGPL
jgi:hypothetical protein